MAVFSGTNLLHSSSLLVYLFKIIHMALGPRSPMDDALDRYQYYTITIIIDNINHRYLYDKGKRGEIHAHLHNKTVMRAHISTHTRTHTHTFIHHHIVPLSCSANHHVTPPCTHPRSNRASYRFATIDFRNLKNLKN